LKQPTGGVILLHDTSPEEPKDLLELKVKKTKVAPAPTTEGVGSASGASAAAQALNAFGGGSLRGGEDDEEAILSALAESRREAEARRGQEDAQESSLHLLDDGPEGEAEVPDEFEYWSENEHGDDDAMEE
jgi:26S proteasome regulatory subunit N2